MQPGSNFSVSFYAKTTGISSVALRFTNPATNAVLGTATVDVSSASSAWKQFTAVVTIPATSAPTVEAAFELVAHSAGVIHLDAVSAFPGDAVGGLWRKDVFDMLKAMKPGFIRLPGGNYLEGTGMRTRWNWKATIGPREARVGHYNTAWYYWVTDAVGLYELLLLCEMLNTTPQLSVYTGYSMGRPYVARKSPLATKNLLEVTDGLRRPPSSRPP